MSSVGGNASLEQQVLTNGSAPDGSAIAYRLPFVGAAAEAATRRRYRRPYLVLAADVVLLLVAVGLATALVSLRAAAGSFAWATAFGVLTVVLIFRRGGYRWAIGESLAEHLVVIVAATWTAIAFIVTLRVLTGQEADAGAFVPLAAFSAAALASGRIAECVVNRRLDAGGTPTLIVGAGSVGRLVGRRLLERAELGLTPIGFLDKNPRESTEQDLPPVLGASWDLERVVREHGVEHVVVTFSTAPHDVLLSLVKRCRALGLEVSLVPRLFETISNRVSLEHLGSVPLLRVDEADPRGWQFEVKYAIDRIAAAALLVLMLPVLAPLALLVKLSSPGPILYRQARVGLDGRQFDIFKFRTMRVADRVQPANVSWAARQLGGADLSPSAVDDRRTAIGRLMRRWSVDELPQLLNIVRGEMSFIGPRPEQVPFVEKFQLHVYRYGDRHRVRSGLTGWAQVHGLRGDTSLSDRVEWDNWYVENWSPLVDLKILAKTVPAVFSGRSAA